MVASEVQLPDEEVEKQFDDDRRDVVETVDETGAENHEREIDDTIKHVTLVGGVVARHKVAKTDRRKRHEAIIQSVDVGPRFFDVVDRWDAAKEHGSNEEEDDQDQVNGRLPIQRAVIVVVVDVMIGIRSAATLPNGVDRPQYEGDERDNALQEQVEEQHATRTSGQSEQDRH